MSPIAKTKRPMAKAMRTMRQRPALAEETEWAAYGKDLPCTGDGIGCKIPSKYHSRKHEERPSASFAKAAMCRYGT